MTTMTTHNTTSRRLFLAAGSSGAVFAALGAAVADSAADPIFSLIARHRAARLAFRPISRLCADNYAKGRETSPAQVAEWDEKGVANDISYDALVSTPPRTLGGMRALFDYCLEEDRLTEDACDVFRTLLKSPLLAG